MTVTIETYFHLMDTTVRNLLYQHPPTVLAVFRTLPLLAKNFVMRLLFVEGNVEVEILKTWTTERKEVDLILDKLINLDIIENLKKSQSEYVELKKNFRTALQIAICGNSEQSLLHSHHKDKADKYKSTEELDKTFKKWEELLGYLLHQGKTNKWWVSLLKDSGLLEATGLTKKGFQFLLQDSNFQVWDFMIAYFHKKSEDCRDLREQTQVITFLFQLSFCTLGKGYPKKSLTDSQLSMLEDLNSVGLVFIEGHLYYPTRLITNLATGLSEKENTEYRKYIVVETNMRLYAYTNNKLEICLLNHFVRFTHRFSNMVVGILSRASVMEALKKGITADQIISYLTSHSHPEMYHKQGEVVPENVSHMIRLWEGDNNRLDCYEACLYSNMSLRKYQEYYAICEKLTETTEFKGCLLHYECNPNPEYRDENFIVLTQAAHIEFKRIVKRRREEKKS